MSRTAVAIAAAGVLLLSLVGCSSGNEEPPAESSSSSSTPSASSSATASESADVQVAREQLAGIFLDVQFIPAQYADTAGLLDSIYPGLTTSDPSCLSPFGVGWDADATLSDAAIEFGTSGDRTMTAVVASTGDATVATDLVAASKAALTQCAEGTGLFTIQGMEVQMTVEQGDVAVTGADEGVSWTVTGTVGGQSFTLTGSTARVGGNVVAIVGWDRDSNAVAVPLATQLFIDELHGS
jgi:hypothetical protein